MKFRSLIPLLLCAVAVVSCAKEQTSAVASRSPEAAPATPVQEVAGEDAARSIVGGSASAPLPQARMIIRTASITVVVRDTAGVMRELTQLAAAEGGYVAQARSWREGDDVRGHISLRVPAAKLDATIEALRKKSVRVESENVSGDDVTEEFSDLRAQLVNLEATEVELRELLSSVRQRTQKAADVLEVYRELVKIRGDIERIRGRMQYLTNLAALATINVDLIPDQLAKPVVTPGWRPLEQVVRAFRALVDALKWIVDALLWVAILVLPLVLVALTPVFLLVWWLRRRKRTNAQA